MRAVISSSFAQSCVEGFHRAMASIRLTQSATHWSCLKNPDLDQYNRWVVGFDKMLIDGPGTRRYELYASVGRGGTAEVFLARMIGPHDFSRVVAVKRLLPELAKDAAVASSFVEEAQLAAGIRHPNVVPMLDVVQDNGEVFLVMEYVEGESLAALMRAAVTNNVRIPIAVVVAIVSDVLAGLHAAHEVKAANGSRLELVHRDVSPQNILVGIDGHARLFDFGIAKALGRASRTVAGTIRGKTAYMPPEQLRGAPLDRRSDIYAVGVLLWEALVARRLFPSESSRSLSARAEIPRPSDERPGVASALDDIALRALAFDPNGRYGSAEEMACALEAAHPAARPREVAAWVNSQARESLAQRRDEIARAPDASTIGTLEIARQGGPPKLSFQAPPARPDEALPSKPKRRTKAAFAVGLGLILAAGAAVLTQMPRSAATVVATLAEGSSITGVERKVESAVVRGAPAEPSTLAANDSGPGTLTPPAPNSVMRKAVYPRSSGATPNGASPPSSIGSKACTPPFTLDADGRRHYVRGCF